MKLTSPEALAELRKKLIAERDPAKPVVIISAGTCGRAQGAQLVAEAFRSELEKRNLSDKIVVRVSGCHGYCQAEPIVIIKPDDIFYRNVRAEDVAEIIDETILNKRLIERLLASAEGNGNKVIHPSEVPFYTYQQRLLMSLNELIDPTSIEDYIAIGGYSALVKVLTEYTPEQVIEEVKKSGLRGRGGGGFPTGRKWESCRKAKGDVHYVICNADEGDPGAYMDRSLLEGNPHSILEGMIIGAYAIGANEGFIYVRTEYPLAVKHTTIAVEKARELGLLGDNILGTGFRFDIKIVKGSGAFVCGESTALMASIEGRAGEPRAKHIHTVESGLWNQPTNLNNVETWANVPLIIQKGADWYAQIGTENSKGTKIFSLVGAIKNTGLVEVPMGITLRDIIFKIGGGIPGDRKFKAVQTGGPSGGCLPEEYLDLPVDFDRLYEAGSMMGSGGMIVMDENTCMVDVAKYFVNFLKDESCGKCTPCREGLTQMYQILTDITEGRGEESHIDTLEWLCDIVANTSLCALGGSAPNPVMSTLRYFRDEYIAHIKERRCPAHVCKALVHYSIDPEKCTGCGVCRIKCSAEAISGEKQQTHIIDEDKCVKCGVCKEVCKFDAIIIR